jgi:hypothetical protein
MEQTMTPEFEKWPEIKQLRKASMFITQKKTVYHNPVTLDQLSAEKTLEQMTNDREKLIQQWGEEVYDQRRRVLEEHIRNKANKNLLDKS